MKQHGVIFSLRRLVRKVHGTFVPHSSNRHHPHILRTPALVVLAGIVIGSELLFGFQELVSFSSPNYLAAVLPAAVVDLTNQERSQQQLGILAEDPQLTSAAQAAAQDMADRGYFAHVSPDGITPWDWLQQSGYAYAYAGENLAVDFTDSDSLMQAWMNSPTHRSNIVSAHYTQIGVGMATGTYQGKSAIFVVQFFASPGKNMGGVSPQTVHSVESTVATATAMQSEVALSAATTTKLIQPAVLGASTAAKIPASPLSSPRTTTTRIFEIIATIVALPFFFALLLMRLPHRKAITRGIAFAAVIILLGFVDSVAPPSLHLTTAAQSAAVAEGAF